MSIASDLSVSVRPARRVRPVPASGRGDTASRGSELQCRELLEALPAAVYTIDAAGRITFFNQAAADLWGCRPQLGKSEWCGSWRLYWPDDRPMRHDECPMAVALKEGRPIRGAEAVAERPDGTRVFFLAYPIPLRDKSGAVTGAVNTLVDVTERKRFEEFEKRLASIVESSDDAIVSKDLDGIIKTWNPGAERLFGYAAEEVIGKPITLLIPIDRHGEESDILSRIRRGERIDHYETVRRRKDGSLIEISVTVSPIENADGRIIGASKIARDITERKRAQEQKNILLREMSHRIKNLFAVTSGLLTLSARSARTPADMAEAVRGRLGALARAHGLTRPGLINGEDKPGQGTTLHVLVQTIFAPYVDPDRVEGHGFYLVTGPCLPIGGNAVTSVALILHELATNAVKYGALSSPRGYIHIDWSVKKDEFLLTWKEHGGPSLAGPPEHEGFGSSLVRRLVTDQFGGQLSYDWKPKGLIIRLSMPVERLTL
ncbi:MAG TPA: PAS domain S-box protein [Methylocella sp.]